MCISGINIPGYLNQSAVPCGTVSPIISESVGRDNARKLTVRTLRIGEILKPFFICRKRRKVKERMLSRKQGIACPAKLFAVRTVGRQTEIIIKRRPECALLKLIESTVRAFKNTRRFQIGVHILTVKRKFTDSSV